MIHAEKNFEIRWGPWRLLPALAFSTNAGASELTDLNILAEADTKRGALMGVNWTPGCESA